MFDSYPSSLTRTDTDGTWSFSKTTSGTNAFLQTTVTSPNPAANTSVYTFEPGGTYYLASVVVHQGSGTVLSSVTNCYNTTNPSPSTCNPISLTAAITELDTFTQPGGVTTWSREEKQYDQYGNTTLDALFDFGATTPTRQTVVGPFGYTWNGSTSSPTCTTAIGNGINNEPCQVQLKSGSGSQLRNRYLRYGTTTYPGSLLSSAVLTSAGGSKYLTSTATYNTNGTLLTSADPNGNPTSYTPGTCGRPEAITPAISDLLRIE